MQTEPPDMDKTERARHDGLLACGYRFCGWDELASAHLYERRFYEREEPDGDKCCVHIFRYPPLGHGDSRRWYTYAAEIYFNPGFDCAIKLLIYAFASDELMERLPEIEEMCVSTWDRLRRR